MLPEGDLNERKSSLARAIPALAKRATAVIMRNRIAKLAAASC